MTEGIHSRFLLKKSEEDAAKEAPVCPEGKEKSVGALINSGTDVFTLKGRGLAISGFKIKLQVITSINSPIATQIPALRVFEKAMSIKEQMIHIAPASANFVTIGIKASRKPHRRFDCMKSKIAKSMFKILSP